VAPRVTLRLAQRVPTQPRHRRDLRERQLREPPVLASVLQPDQRRLAHDHHGRRVGVQAHALRSPPQGAADPRQRLEVRRGQQPLRSRRRPQGRDEGDRRLRRRPLRVHRCSARQALRAQPPQRADQVLRPRPPPGDRGLRRLLREQYRGYLPGQVPVGASGSLVAVTLSSAKLIGESQHCPLHPRRPSLFHPESRGAQPPTNRYQADFFIAQSENIRNNPS